MAQSLKVSLDSGGSITALLYAAAATTDRGITVVLGHGAGAGQTNSFMVKFATGLAERGLDSVTFNFPYTEMGRRIPDPGPRLESCYRAVIVSLAEQPGLLRNRLVIGGKSMGGRIASQVAADGLEGVSGLVFLGYPLHPPGKPEQLRDKHLPKISAPALFVQGSRDSFGTPEELIPVIERMGPRAALYVVEEGDHSFKIPKKLGTSQDEVYSRVMDKIVEFASGLT